MSETPFADMLRDPKQYLMTEDARHGLAESVAILERKLAERIRISEMHRQHSEIWAKQLAQALETGKKLLRRAQDAEIREAAALDNLAEARAKLEFNEKGARNLQSQKEMFEDRALKAESELAQARDGKK